MLDDLRSCGPGKRHKLKVIENKNSNISGDNNNNDNEKKKKEDELKAKEDLLNEVNKLSKKIKDMNKESVAVVKSKATNKNDVKKQSKARIEKVDVVSKRPRLGFLEEFKK